MEVLHTRCAGLDLSKRDAKLCVRIASAGRGRASQEITTWSSMTAGILALRDHLVKAQVSCVVMEATGDYWKPFYYLLEECPFEVMLVNPHDARNLPGRKTDVSDAAWLAELAAHGLLRASFVPPQPIRELRDLTRTRTAVTRERARAAQRLEKVLEDAGIKLSVVATDITGSSGRAILAAMVAGQRDPGALADLSIKRLRSKIPALIQALTGRFTDHHGFLVRLHLNLIEQHDAAIATLTRRIDEAMTPFRAAHELLCTIPGIGIATADVIIAETGGDMSVFPGPGQLASWAGTCPGHHESAGRVGSTKTRPGNRWLKGALGAAAMSIARHPGTFLNAKYQRLVRTRGRAKGIVAIEHTLLTVIWNMLTTSTPYEEPGSDYYARRNPQRVKEHAIQQLKTLGFDITLQPRPAT